MEMTTVRRANLCRELFDLYKRLAIPDSQLTDALQIHRQTQPGMILELRGIKHVITEVVDPLSFRPNDRATQMEDERISQSIAVYLRPYDYAETRACSSWLCWHRLWDGLRDGTIKVYAMHEVKYMLLPYEPWPFAI